jgi:hypothetical protein
VYAGKRSLGREPKPYEGKKKEGWTVILSDNPDTSDTSLFNYARIALPSAQQHALHLPSHLFHIPKWKKMFSEELKTLRKLGFRHVCDTFFIFFLPEF